MNRLLFMAMVLAGWILFAAINRGFFFDKILATPRNTLGGINNDSESSIPQNFDLKDEPLQDRIQQELYSSISTGMSYAEVSSIIGWEGVLIYESNINNGGEVIHSKVYRWNYDDLYLGNSATDELIDKRNINSDRSLILEFQNDILIELDFSHQNLY